MINNNINKSKKNINYHENKTKKLPIKKKYNTYVKKQHGGGDTYDITLYSNYSFPYTTNVAAKLDDIYKNDGSKKTELGKKLFRYTNLLTNPEFETLYLKSNFTITNTTTTEVSHINTNQNAFLNFQSLILLELCYYVFNYINYDRLVGLSLHDREKKNEQDYEKFVKKFKYSFDLNEISTEKLLLLLLFPLKIFLYNMENTTKEIKKKYSITYHEKKPLGLYLINYLLNEFTERNIKIFEIKFTIPESTNKDIEINIPGTNFISYKTGANFNTIKELLDKIKELYINDINQKFNYVYNRDIAIKFLFDVLFNFD
jgi:hypothetical protein